MSVACLIFYFIYGKTTVAKRNSMSSASHVIRFATSDDVGPEEVGGESENTHTARKELCYLCYANIRSRSYLLPHS